MKTGMDSVSLEFRGSSIHKQQESKKPLQKREHLISLERSIEVFQRKGKKPSQGENLGFGA